MTAYQYKLEGGMMIATGNAISDQLAEIMETEPDTRDDEDLLAARWLELYGGFDNAWIQALSRWSGPDGDTHMLKDIIAAYRRPDIPHRRRELAEMGLYP